MKYRAILWDVDGTVAETERDGHRVAFNHVFTDFGINWHWDEKTYGRLLEITGGKERMRQYALERGESVSSEQIAQMHVAKNEQYAKLIAKGGIGFRSNVAAWIKNASSKKLAQGIVTTTSRANLSALMQANLGESWHDYFVLSICGEDVNEKKPHPEAYQSALDALNIGPNMALAIEDSPNGLKAATAAKIDCLITAGQYFKSADFTSAKYVYDSLPTLDSFIDLAEKGDA